MRLPKIFTVWPNLGISLLPAHVTGDYTTSWVAFLGRHIFMWAGV